MIAARGAALQKLALILVFTALALPIQVTAHQGDSTLVAPILQGIVIDGDLSDWPTGMEKHYMRNHENYYGPTDLEGQDLTTSPDLTATFMVGYNPDQERLYFAVEARDDHHVLHDYEGPWVRRDLVEIYVDGDHSGGYMDLDGMQENLDPGPYQHLQYMGMAGEGPLAPENAPSNYFLNWHYQPQAVAMAYDRQGDTTIYEWAVAVYDRYPGHPTRLVPGKTLGFDISVTDQDGYGNAIMVSWGLHPSDHWLDADTQSDLVLGHTRLGADTALHQVAGTLRRAEQAPTPLLRLEALHNDQPVAQTTSRADGGFELPLPKGRYQLRLQPGQGYSARPIAIEVLPDQPARADLLVEPIALPQILTRTAALYGGLTHYRDSLNVEIDGGLETTTAAFTWSHPGQLRLERVDWTTGNMHALYRHGRQHSQYASEYQQYAQHQGPEKLAYSYIHANISGLGLVPQLLLSDEPGALLRRGLVDVRILGQRRLADRSCTVVELVLTAAPDGLLERAASPRPMALELWLDSQTGALRQVHYQHQGRSHSEYYHRVDTAPTLPADWFAFTPPEGAQQAFYLGEGRQHADILGQPAPSFSLTDPDGNPVHLADYAGQVVLVDFWGTWCPPCRLAMPHLVELQQQYHNQGFAVVAIAVPPDTQAEVRQYAARHGLNFALPLAEGKVQTDYGVSGFPTSFFIDKEGNVRFVRSGYGDSMTALFAAHIEELLAE
ncbi:MAG: redoxin domain-containing protein [Candidatus Latescibacteria bacterium]|nr:redoxin domain-containing protein [Candidatus Latescibacterota bacterium]